MNTNNQTKRILQVFGSLNMGGAESRMMDVYRNIDLERYEFTFLTMNQGEQYYEREIHSIGGKIIKIAPPRKSGNLKNLIKIIRILGDGKYDAVHAHTSFHCGIVMLAGWLAKIPIRISHSRTTGSKNTSVKNKIALCFGRILISAFSTQRLAISHESGEYLFSGKKFTVLPNAIDCEKYFDTADEEVIGLKKQYHIPEDAICLGLVGRFSPMKNHSFALDVFKEYHERNSNSVLIFVGDGDLRPDIEKKAEELNIADRVIFTGIQSNVHVWMKLFNVLLVPSVFEGLGGVILEAQAAATPVLKSDTFTDEADMRIGLVRKLPIDNGVGSWVLSINDCIAADRPDDKSIDEAFSRRGYSLKSEIEKLEHFYRGT